MEIANAKLILDILQQESSTFNDFRTIELAEFINEYPEHSHTIISSLEPHRAVKTLKFLDLKLQKKLIIIVQLD